MSWLDNIIDFGKEVLFGKGLGSQIIKSVATGYALKKITKSIENSNNPVPSNTSGPTAPIPPQLELGRTVQVTANTTNKIPVLYGTAVTGGIITDARMTNNNQTMWYAMSICEQTGVELSTGSNSTIRFREVYAGSQRLVFKSDSVTVDYSVDRNGKIDRSLSGLMRVYLYSGNSALQVWPVDYAAGTSAAAYTRMPGWDSTWEMNDLVFAIVSVDYSREKNVTGIPDMKFKVQNSMTLPGDCMLDYMTNTRYGCGIPNADINTQ